MNGGYQSEPAGVGERLHSYTSAKSNVETSINELTKNGDVSHKKLIKLHNRSVELYKSLLQEKDVEKILTEELKCEIRMINHICIHLFNKYNIQFAERTHDDSRKMNQLIMLLTFIVVLQNVITFPKMIEYNGLIVGTDIVVIILLLILYSIRYIPDKNNINADIDPIVYQKAP